jgi:glycosyltransferase involved in cell wall biosynthesis
MVTAPCQWVSDYVVEKYNVECTTLPNGVDTHIFTPIEGVRARTNVILYVGRFVTRKGLRELFEAAKALPDYEFWIVGDPKTGTVKILPLPNLKVLGFVDSLALCYNQATLCVFPSYWETFSIVGLEAMACGRAIIATKLGFSEYLEDGRDGLVVEPGDPQGLIQSIKYLMEDESARTRIERNAREKALQYDWDIIIKQYRALYEKLH